MPEQPNEWNIELLRNMGKVSFREASEGMLRLGRSLRLADLPATLEHTVNECQLAPYEYLFTYENPS